MRNWPSLLLVSAILAGCVHPLTRESGSEADLRTAFEPPAEQQSPPRIPEEVAAALMPQARTPAQPLLPPEPRFDLNVDDADPRSFFMGLVRSTPYNVVVHPDVSTPISLSLQNVTVLEVMEIVREVYGYEFQRRDNSFIVLPAQLQSEVFEINYLDVRRSGESRTRVSSGQASESPQALAGAAGAGLGAAFGAQAHAQSGSRVETETESDFWQTLAITLEAMVGTAGGRGVIMNRQTGTVVVRAMPAELRQVTDYLQSVQTIAQRQVILEAKVVEVQLREGFESGINWSALIRDGATRSLDLGMVRGRDLFETGASALQGRTIVGPDGAAPSFESEAFGGAFGVGVNTRDFDAFIELLETQGRTHVLSSPRVTALNNQKSVIKVGTDEFFFTGIQTIATPTTTSTVATGRAVQLAPFFSGIALDVTPQISADGNVILHIHPSVSEVTDQVKRFTVEGREDSMPLAVSTIRESDSIVRARSGQVIVIGGLMRTQSRDDSAGLPGLSRVPLIGGLFRHDRQAETKSELVILLRPIVVEDEDWADLVREHRDRAQELLQR
jgi:MSHA biogenesis protein MshL